MDYEHIMNEMAIQMAASQLSRYQRYSLGSTPKRWSGRVEKSRSTHTSPAIHERRRAHSTTRPVQPTIYQYPSYDPYSMPQQRHLRMARPFSWHPTSQTLPVFNVSQMTSPDTPNYIPTPPFSADTAASFQYPAMQTLYPDIPVLQKSTEPTSMMTASPVYSMDPYTSNSPEWDYFYDGQTPVIANNIQPNSSPTYPGSWYDSNCSELPRLAQPMMHLPQLPPMMPQESLSSMIMEQHQQTLPALPAPSFHSIAFSEESIREPQVETREEEEGEVLVALGLYDLPDESAPIATGVAHLKLTETWQPPPEDEDSSQDEEDDEEVKTPGAESSWFH